MTSPEPSVPEPLYRTPDPVDVPGAWFDEEAVERVCAVGRLCRHVKGRWAGTPIHFEPWELEHFIAPVFGWKYPDGRRIRRTGYLEVPKKNGKSTLATVLGIYLTGADREPGAEVYSAAVAKDQARIVFDPARLMVERSPALAKRYRRYANTIVYGADEGIFRVISADARLQDGLNVHGGIIDEVHRHPTRDLIEILELGTAAREQPLILLLTTAGEEGDTSIYAEKHDYCVKVATRLVRDPSFHGVIYAASPDDDIRDEKTWYKANPNLGVTIAPEYIAAKVAEAEASPAKLNSILRFHFNIRTKQVTRWLPLERWDASRGHVDEGKLAGQRCYGGLSIARTQDVASFVLDFPTEAGHKVVCRFFLPRERLAGLDEVTSGMASRWAREGKLRLTPGDVVDYAAIKTQICKDAKAFEVEEIAFNRRGASQLAQELEAEGLVLVEATPGIRLAPATQDWERLVLAKHYEHGGHPVLRYMVDSLSMKQDTEGNSWPDQGRSRGNISGVVAAVMALDCAVRHANDEESVYESRGLLTI